MFGKVASFFLTSSFLKEQSGSGGSFRQFSVDLFQQENNCTARQSSSNDTVVVVGEY